MSAKRDDELPDGHQVSADGMKFQKDVTWGWVLLQIDPDTEEEAAYTLDELDDKDFLKLYNLVMQSDLPLELRNFVRQCKERTSSQHRTRRLH